MVWDVVESTTVPPVALCAATAASIAAMFICSMSTLSADVTHPLRAQSKNVHGVPIAIGCSSQKYTPARQAVLQRYFGSGQLAPGAVAVDLDDGAVGLAVSGNSGI